MGRLYIANCVTIATRIRVDIMKAMATKFTTEKDSLYVTPFSSRPMLHAKQKEGGLRPMAFTFSDAISKYGAGLREADLGEAYRRAGNLFKGQLQQNFVVLHDELAGEVAGLSAEAAALRGKGNIQMKRARGGEGQGPETASPAKAKRT